MLRKIRIALECIFFLCITLLFCGIGEGLWGWMPKLQLLPASLRLIASATWLNAALVGGILLLTVLFGRLYCSVICPLGILQDSMIWLRKKAYKFKPRKNHPWIRVAAVVILIAALLLDLQFIVAAIAPYSIYGRAVCSLLGMYSTKAIIIGIGTIVVMLIIAFFFGRDYCNIVCPVGAVLGGVSHFALFRPVIDPEKCVGCHSCEKKCKAGCIDSESRTIDTSRCVDCFDCIDDCKAGAIRYRVRPMRKTPKREGDSSTDVSRRAFLGSAALLTGALTLHAEEQKLDGGLAAIEGKKEPVRQGRLVPPGAKGEKHFYDYCTACQLCIASCPNHVLKPSTDLLHLSEPVMSYTDGFCRPECTTCSDVCPSGAILKITPEEKSVTRIGQAMIDLDLCVVTRDGVKCGNCAYHCPAEAIKMVHPEGDKSKPAIPAVIEGKCIGCGKCEFLCAARPYSAIHVDALKTHISNG